MSRYLEAYCIIGQFSSEEPNRARQIRVSMTNYLLALVARFQASMHMISKKDMSVAEMDTLTKSCSPTIVITANGQVQAHEEAIVYVKELDIFLTMKVLEDTPAVLSLGKLCDEHGYSYESINGQNHISLEYSVIRKTSYQSWFLVDQRVLPQACLLHLQRKFIIQITLQQSC